MEEVHGEKGRAWLAGLPSWLRECTDRWELVLDDPFPNLSYNYVAPAIRSDGSRVVLKTAPLNPEFLREMNALREFNGRGSVRLLEGDPLGGAMLLCRVAPGTMLSEVLDDDAATRIGAGVMSKLWNPAAETGDFPSAERWTQALDLSSGQLPAKIVDRAKALRREMLESSSERILLHGDLHHFNILQSDDESWLAIDPKGVVGERAMEIAAFLSNPRLESSSVLRRRIDVLCELLSLDRERVRAWAVILGVTSACWTIEDHGEGWEEPIEFARRVCE